MRIATIIVRVLLGLLLLFSSIAYFFHLFPEPELSGDMKTFNEGLAASKYLIPLVKIIELLCGVAFVSGKFIKLANIVFLPVAVNILLTHIFLAPEGLMVAAFVFLANIFLIYRYWDSYKGMLTVN